MPGRDHKRLKCTPTTPPTPHQPEATEAEDISALASAKSPQILQLPVELWLEIVSYFPAVPIPTRRITCSPVLPPSSLDRSDVLRSLSQTCHTLRAMFFEQAWERIEVCAIRARKSNSQKSSGDYSIEGLNYGLDQIPGSWYLGVSRTLQLKCEGLARHPECAALVRTVNVVLTRCSVKTVLLAFARCMEILPNLHTLQILRAHTQMTTHLKKVFEGRSFPSIRTIILPTHAHEILRCCKNARIVVCNHGDGSQLLTAMAKGNKKVERLEGFMPDDNQAKRIVKAAPKLRVIKFSGPIPPSALRILSSLKDINTIELRTRQDSEEMIPEDHDLVACIKIAKDILRKVEGKRSLTVRHESWPNFAFHEWVKAIDIN